LSLWPASWSLVVLMTLIQVANDPRIVMRTSTWDHHNLVNTVSTNVRQLPTLILIAAANPGAISGNTCRGNFDAFPRVDCGLKCDERTGLAMCRETQNVSMSMTSWYHASFCKLC
jgi:hypothetical protein